MLDVPVIARYGVLLSPTTDFDTERLHDAYDDDSLFTYFPSGVRSLPPKDGSVAAALSDPGRLPLTVRTADQRTVVGSTSLYDIADDAKQVTVGYTWFSRAVHRSGINQRCKLALFEWLFETWGAHRLCLYVDNQNGPSRAAVLALGATEEGRLRQHARRRDGTYRDTIVYSILDHEWEATKMSLLTRINRST
ncbi:GNAT family N-acetyltransferase [Williamsia sp. MIQD14]|uniref:GNAT family N-acetyltransferase n=1 Tax=Williamsia sp. MIQD14 TaxID=3425703 RepID=UPI003D9FB456